MTPVPETTVGDVPEMVERVARAIAEWGSGKQSQWTVYVDPARAAIAAMREPTEAMVDVPWSLELVATDSDVWRAQIDAALGNPPVAR